MTFAGRVFFLAGIYGLLALGPMYFREGRSGRDVPAAVTHPEHHYGFVGVAPAWQLVFLVIARDPSRYRPMMVPSILEKLSFGGAVWPSALRATDPLNARGRQPPRRARPGRWTNDRGGVPPGVPG